MIDNFLAVEFPPETRRLVVFTFFWSGLAIWVGLIARVIIPSRYFRNPWAIFCLGWIGVALGPLVVRTFLGAEKFDPISPSGLVVSVLFSVIATLIYHVFSFLFSNGDEADYQGSRQKDEMNELRELEEKYKDVSHADLLRAFDASRRFQTGQGYSADRTRNY